MLSSIARSRCRNMCKRIDRQRDGIMHRSTTGRFIERITNVYLFFSTQLTSRWHHDHRRPNSWINTRARSRSVQWASPLWVLSAACVRLKLIMSSTLLACAFTHISVFITYIPHICIIASILTSNIVFNQCNLPEYTTNDVTKRVYQVNRHGALDMSNVLYSVYICLHILMLNLQKFSSTKMKIQFNVLPFVD